MSIQLTDELEVKTKKGKLASANQIYLDGDQENVQQIGEKTHQLEQSIKDISASGGASTANAVSYNNETSGMTAINAQGAIDELAEKNKSQDVVINTKADASDVTSKMQTEQKRVNAELDKKFDKENIAQELGDSDAKVVSQYALPFREIESPEFLHCLVDSEDHFLFGIQLDGSVEWGKGIPMPIKAKLQEIINQSKQDKTDLTTAINTAKEEISASLQQYEDTTDATLADLKDNKVDKEEGKSLIDDEVKEHFSVIENEEWLCAMTDAEDRVLFGIHRETGKPYYPLNDMYHVEQNEEFFAVWLDADNHVLLGIRRDGQIIGEIHAVNSLKEVISNLQDEVKALQDKLEEQSNAIAANQGDITAIKENAATTQEKITTLETNLQEFLSVFSLQDNPEYLAVETDAEGRMLATTNLDGSHYSRNLQSETIDAKVDKEEGKSLINSDVADSQSTIEDPEGRMEITTDADGKVLAERKQDGEKHEVKMDIDNLKVSNISLQGNSVNNIQDALKANGFNIKYSTDWSDNSSLEIPEPRLAFVNITNITKMPTSKTQNLHGIFEFWDMQGNYFKKKVILNAQGNSSMGMPKKNFACDFCNDEWVGDDTFKIRFGNWVFQDSFHFKAYYADFFKGISIVGYKLFYEIENTRSFNSNRVWKRALLPSNDTIGYGTKGMSDITDMNLLIDNGARCYPDGFPCIVNLNGEFHGVFSWALKKHRDNYMQNKSKAEHIQLDGDIYDTFTYDGDINWNVIDGIEASSGGGKDGFEFRNPKSLICIDGSKYDADTNRKELIDSSSSSYKADNKKHVLTNKVKEYYKTLTTYIPTLNSMVSENQEETEIKSTFLSFFDVESLIDYLILSDVTCNYDGFRKNWQWVTYDGIKWAVCPYDLDSILGWSSWGEENPMNSRYGNSLNIPTGWVIKYFDAELCERYKVLRAKVLTEENIFRLLTDWCARIGTSNLEKDLAKYPMTPDAYSAFSEEHTDNIYRVYNWLVKRLEKCDSIYKFN